jgi:hypothetical protein
MQVFTLAIICCVMLNDYLVKLLGLPGIMRFLPEAMSAVVILYVLVAGTQDRFRLVAPKYWIVFAALAVVLLCGVINGAPGVGPVLSGSRFYLRAVPLFFLPAVLPPSDHQLKRQFKWLLALGLLQVPMAIYQRWLIQSEQRASGDDVIGTLMDSGILSLFLICAVAVLTGLLLRRRLGARWYWILAILLVVPTGINETKATVFFLPLAVLVTLFVGTDRGKRLRNLSVALMAIAAAVALYIPVYNMMETYNPFKNEKNIMWLFTDQGRLGKYLSSDVGGVGTTKDVRRGDAIVVPYEFLARDPVRLTFGLGLGAVSPSTLGKNFEGSYYHLFEKFLILTFTFFLLEFGVLGVLLIAALFWLVFLDTLSVARRDETLVGALAVGWTGVVVLFALCVFYTVYHEFISVTYLYWYFSGVMCARSRALALAGENIAGGNRMMRPRTVMRTGLGETR